MPCAADSVIVQAENLPLRRRIVLAASAVLLVSVALASTDYLINGLAGAEPGETLLYEGIPLDATLLHLDKRALEEAYHQYLLLLFSIWLKSDIAEEQRIRNGLRKARKAYNAAAQQIAKREQELLEMDRQSQQRRGR